MGLDDNVARRIVEERLAHEQERHHPPLDALANRLGKTPTEMMNDFVATVETSKLIVDALEGPEIVHVDGTVTRDRRAGLIGKVDDIQNKLANGVRHRLEITKLQYALAGTVVAALATIGVALLTGGS